MPEKKTIERARKDKRQGKSPSTQAGEFVREEIHHVREGKHGARSAKQVIAIGLAKARRAGVKLPPGPDGEKSASPQKASHRKVSRKRSRAMLEKLRKEGRAGASKKALGRQARRSAAARGPKKRHEAAMKAVRTKGRVGLRKAAKKAARTRSRS
jgi:hypothetical protein